jgi:hypothetical protein
LTAIIWHCGRTRRWSTRRRWSNGISGPWSARLESRVGYVNERVGGKCRRKEWAGVQMLAIRGAKHLRAQPHLEALQAVQWTRHMGAQPHQNPVQEMQQLRAKHLKHWWSRPSYIIHKFSLPGRRQRTRGPLPSFLQVLGVHAQQNITDAKELRSLQKSGYEHMTRFIRRMCIFFLRSDGRAEVQFKVQ